MPRTGGGTKTRTPALQYSFSWKQLSAMARVSLWPAVIDEIGAASRVLCLPPIRGRPSIIFRMLDAPDLTRSRIAAALRHRNNSDRI